MNCVFFGGGGGWGEGGLLNYGPVIIDNFGARECK